MSALSDGSSDGPRSSITLQEMVDADAVMKREAEKQATSQKGFGTPREATHQLAAALPERLEEIVKLNAHARLHGDLAIVPTRGEKHTSIAGESPMRAGCDILWPRWTTHLT